MTEETTFTLPKIPQLLGEENLEEWKASIHNHFEWYDILQYLTNDVPEPPATNAQAQKVWKQARLKGKITIHSTLNNKTVRDKLKNSGWNPVEDADPKAIYELVLRVIPSTSEEALSSLYVEFCTLNRAKYDSLTAFQTRVTYLKSRLEALDCLPPEKGNLIVVINALKSTYPDWHNFLIYDFENKDLTWKKLMQDMSKRANHELSEMSLVAIKPQDPKTSDNNAKNNTANLNSNANRTRVFCKDCGFKHWSTNKWCEQCKQHEEDKWVWCSTCNRHHGKEWRRCKAKANGSSDTTPSSTLSNMPNASARALNTTTGLPVGITRLSQMAIKAELFEKRYIDRDSVLLDTACFNHLFNSKRWFIEYEDINPLSIGASNGGTGAAIGKGTVRVPLLLPDGSVNVLEMPNTMYQPATPCNLISAGQLERNKVVQNGFNKTVCFKDSKVVLGQYTIIDNVFVMVTPPKTVGISPPAFAAPLLKRQQKVDYVNVDYITQVRIQDGEVEQIEEENTPFATPPMTPTSTLEHSIVQSLQPTGKPASEEPVLPTQQPTRRSSGSTIRHDYKAFNVGKKSKKLTMVTIPSERQIPPTVLALSTIKATGYQRDQNGREQRQVPKSYWDARKGAKWEGWKPALIC